MKGIKKKYANIASNHYKNEVFEVLHLRKNSPE